MYNIKKFESFEKEMLYEKTTYKWFMKQKRDGITDKEYFKLKEFFTGYLILPNNPPTKHNNVPSSFCEISVMSKGALVLSKGALVLSNMVIKITKLEDDWWVARKLTNNNCYEYFKCDTIQGVIQLIKFLNNEIP